MVRSLRDILCDTRISKSPSLGQERFIRPFQDLIFCQSTSLVNSVRTKGIAHRYKRVKIVQGNKNVATTVPKSLLQGVHCAGDAITSIHRARHGLVAKFHP